MEYKYVIENFDGDIQDATVFSSLEINTPSYIAEDAAIYCFDNMEKEDWGDFLIFAIYSMDNKFIGRYDIYLRMESSFVVIPIMRENDDIK